MDWLKKIGQSQNLADIMSICLAEITSLGADRVGYLYAAGGYSHSIDDVLIVQRGFSSEWMALYEQRNFRDCDPVPDFIKKHGIAAKWHDVFEQLDLTSEQAEYVETLHRHGMYYGFNAPLYGPLGMEAYVAVGFDDPQKLDDTDNLTMMITIAQAGHRRAIAIAQQNGPGRPSLSRRETEVLYWITRSKSNVDIGTIIGISAATVEVYVRRLYTKLQVHDRISATIRGLQLGLVKM